MYVQNSRQNRHTRSNQLLESRNPHPSARHLGELSRHCSVPSVAACRKYSEQAAERAAPMGQAAILQHQGNARLPSISCH